MRISQSSSSGVLFVVFFCWLQLFADKGWGYSVNRKNPVGRRRPSNQGSSPEKRSSSSSSSSSSQQYNNNNNANNQYSYRLTANQWEGWMMNHVKKNENQSGEGMIFLDLENIRGKSNFEYTHERLYDRIINGWSRPLGWPMGRLSMIVDHGSIPSAYYLPDDGCSVIFSGPHCKADDVLVRDLRSFLFPQNVNGNQTAVALIVTADNELMKRCRQCCQYNPERHQVQFVHPHMFLEQIEKNNNNLSKLDTNNDDSSNKKDDDNKSSSSSSSSSSSTTTVLTPDMINNLEEEIKLRGAMYETEMELKNHQRKNKKKKKQSPKERRKLEKRARMLCERLAQKGSSSKGGGGIEQFINTSPNLTPHEQAFQNEVLYQWQKLRQTATRREMTGDRMLLAEYFRRSIILPRSTTTTNTNTNKINGADDSDDQQSIHNSITYQYVQHVQSLFDTTSTTKASSSSSSVRLNIEENIIDDSKNNNDKPLRVLVLSDTHGMERQLGKTLPEADVLLHLGDFSIDHPRHKIRSALENFDSWLSQQPCPVKIVLKGNHDPPQWKFPLSGAQYITRPKSLSLNGGRFQILCIPYVSARILSSTWRKLPSLQHCDILASHVPPRYILDKTLSKTHAGCPTLRMKVEKQMLAGPPRVWTCGHIHEGRGHTTVTFGNNSYNSNGSKGQTMVINASNANDGPAKYIQYAPTLFDIYDSNYYNTHLHSDNTSPIVDLIPPKEPFIPKPQRLQQQKQQQQQQQQQQKEVSK